MKKIGLLNCASMVALSLGVVATPAVAQDGNDAASNDDDLIIVTTTRRETNLLETPAAVTAIGGETLVSDGIFNAADFDNLVPNLKIQDQTSQGVGAIQITLRGIGNSSFIEIGDPNVALHVDGVYASRPQAALNLLFDAQRLEVARGPQGTLYGRNATVGNINIINNRPDASDFSVSLGGELGNFANRIVNGVINVPIIEDVLAIRAAGFLQRRDTQYNLLDDEFIEAEYQSRLGIGLEENPYRQVFGDGLSEDDGAGSIDQEAWRFALNFTPADNFSVYASYEQFDNNSPFKPQSVRGNEYTAYLSNPQVFDQNIKTFRGELNYEIANAVEFKAVGGFQEYDHRGLVDLDAGTSRYSSENDPLAETRSGVARNITFEQAFSDTWRTDSHSFEATLSSSYDSPLQWLAGYYRFKEDTFRSLWVDLPLNNDGIINFNQPSRTAKSEAFFGRLEYAITDRINISGGVRYTDEERVDTGVNRFDSFPGGQPLQAFGAPVLIDQSGQTQLQFLCQGNPPLGPCDPAVNGDQSGGFLIDNVAQINGLPLPGAVGPNLRIPTLFQGFNAAPGSPIGDIQAGIAAATAPGSQIFDSAFDPASIQAVGDILSAGGTPALIHGAASFPRVFFTENNNDYVDWQVTLDFTPVDGTFLYATVATGHKAGSREIFYQPRLGQFINSGLEPEELISYEVGWKQQFGFGLDLSSTFFYMDYKDKQQSLFVDGGDLFCDATFGDFNGDGLLENFLPFVSGVPIFSGSTANLAPGVVSADNVVLATGAASSQQDVVDAINGGTYGDVIGDVAGFALTQSQIDAAITSCSQGSTGAGGALADNPGVPNFVELMQINFGDAKIAGFEFEYSWDITPRDRLSGFLTLNVVNELSNANTDALPFNLTDALACGDRVGGCPSVAAVDGNELPFAPDITFRAAYERDFVINGLGTITPGIDVTYNGSYFLSVWNVRCYDSIRLGTEVCNNGDFQEDFTLVDLKLRFTPENLPVYIEAYGRNVTNKSYATNAQRPSNDDFVTAYTFNDRPTWGIRAAGTF